MGVKYVCDWCGDEVKLADLKTVNIANHDETPAHSPQEICVFCKEKLLKVMADIIAKFAGGKDE